MTSNSFVPATFFIGGYRFKDYKEKVIDLLARVTRVGVKTQKIVEEMRKAAR